MILPFEPLIECKQNIVVYDNDSVDFSNSDKAPAIRVAKALSRAGAQVPVKVLYGGFQEFSKNYPFMRSTKNTFTARELDSFQTYPIEILQGSLYLGTSNQSNKNFIRKNLKLDAFLNFSDAANDSNNNADFMEINTNNLSLDQLKQAAEFIDSHRIKNNRVLISCASGRAISATMAIYYLIHSTSHSNPISKKDAIAYVATCKTDIFQKGKILNAL